MKKRESRIVIVTGNSGFVGRYLTSALLREGHSVVGIDIEQMDKRFIFDPDKFTQEIVDLRNFAKLNKVCEKLNNVDFVFHTVAIQPTSNNMDIVDYLDTNFIGSSNLISVCSKHGFKNIILSSSFSIYGKPQYLPIDEVHPTAPRNPYGISKFLTEQLYEYYSRMNDFHITVLRYDGIYNIKRC